MKIQLESDLGDQGEMETWLEAGTQRFVITTDNDTEEDYEVFLDKSPYLLFGTIEEDDGSTQEIYMRFDKTMILGTEMMAHGYFAFKTDQGLLNTESYRQYLEERDGLKCTVEQLMIKPEER